MPIQPTDTINENSSAQITFTVTEGDLTTVIPVSSIDTATYTLKNKHNDVVINSRTSISFKSGITEAGVATINLGPLDSPIISKSNRLKEEIHIMTISIVTNTSPVLTLTEELWLTVLNLKHTSS